MDDIVVMTDTVDDFIAAIAQPVHGKPDSGDGARSRPDHACTAQSVAHASASVVDTADRRGTVADASGSDIADQWGDFSMDDELVRRPRCGSRRAREHRPLP
jgi:hypothetical protein